ncbi:MAG: DNA methyltransferase, partial [Lentisphaerae bacterium]|nr:DNA methyltransferase [Lentisphaerota bacterium]
LRAVLKRIATTLQDKGGDALMANDLKRAAMNRVFGFEILPAPFVIAHLQLGLELETLGAPLGEHLGQPERVGVYLTNALTGWEPPKEKAKQITFPGFDNERDAANKVKQEKPILVIIGNPPYNAYAGVSPEEENDLVQPYKEGLYTEWGIKKFNLDDLYIRFFRLAEKRVAEHGGRGVVSFISNFSYLGDPSFVVARRRFLNEFDAMWFDCLNGDSRETGKLTPDGNPDPSVFSTEWNREGIRVGTAIGLLVKRNREREQTTDTTIRFRHFWGTNKRGELLASLDANDFDGQYDLANPSNDNRWSFRPSDVADAYLTWPKLTDLCAEAPSNGLMEKRGRALMDDDRNALEARMRRYFDQSISFDDLKREEHPLTKDAARYDARTARAKISSIESFTPERIRRYALRPYEHTYCYFTPTRPIWNEPRPTLAAQCWEGNAFLLSRFNCAKDSEGVPFYFARSLSDDHLLSPDAAAFPLRLRSVPKTSGGGKFLPGMADEASDLITANLSQAARAYLSALGHGDADGDPAVAELIWYHALAIGYSPAYLREHADGVRQDWPRIPLPHTRETLAASAALGRQIAALLDTEAPAPGVTAGKIPEKLKTVAVFTRPDGKPVNLAAGDLDLTAGWGHAGKGGVTMPGKGKLHNNDDGTCDVFLNDVTCWQNIPTAVWEYCIGGYQVIKKWLSYREKTLLGRGLTIDEVRYVTDMARRIAALVDLHVSLDDNYRQTCTHIYPWQKN